MSLERYPNGGLGVGPNQIRTRCLGEQLESDRGENKRLNRETVIEDELLRMMHTRRSRRPLDLDGGEVQTSPT